MSINKLKELFKLHEDDNVELLNGAIEENNIVLFNQLFPLVLSKLKGHELPNLALLFGDKYEWDENKTIMFGCLFEHMHKHDSQKQKERDFIHFLRFSARYFANEDDLTYLSDFMNMAQKFIDNLSFTERAFREQILNTIEEHGFNRVLTLLLNTPFNEDDAYFEAALEAVCYLSNAEIGLQFLNELHDFSEEKVQSILTKPRWDNVEKSFLEKFIYVLDQSIFKRLVELGARLTASDINYIDEYLMQYEDTQLKIEFYYNYLEKESLDNSLVIHANKKQFKI